MSRYDWEHGTLKVPHAAYAPLKKAMRDAFNARQTLRFTTAQEVFRLASAALKGRRSVTAGTIAEAIGQAMNSLTPVASPSYGWSRPALPRFATEDADRWQIERVLCPHSQPATPRPRLQSPKRKDFPLATNRTLEYETTDESWVSFDDAKHEVSWRVSENNHAVEHAREGVLSQAFFTVLAKVNWTRGSGGVFVGNDEYNRDTHDEGGGGNYVTQRFGPAGVDHAMERLLRGPRRSRRATVPEGRFR